jgi:predicted ATPase
LLQAVSEHAQVLISTQSSTFVDSFDPEDIVVVERVDEATTFERPRPGMLEAWLEDYSLGEIWEKNVIGGGPH